MERASGSKTSVHVGCFMRDYELMLMNDPEMHAVYKTTGTASAMLANRLSWFYNLKGPSLSLDTACSSSLTALHLACQSIRCGESTMVRHRVAARAPQENFWHYSDQIPGTGRWLQSVLQPRHHNFNVRSRISFTRQQVVQF